MSRALISLLMPVSAPAPYLSEALTSIVEQEFEDWELVLVVDGTDPAITQAARDAIPSSKLILVERSVRGGIAVALNDGLRAAQGQWVARLDADDRAHPLRLRKQSAYLEDHPETVLLGASAVLIDVRGHETGTRTVASSGSLARLLVQKNRFVHSSVMFSAEVARRLGGYDEAAHLREDYELWMRMAQVGDTANIHEPLVDYRLSPNQISRRRPTRRSLNRIWRAQRELAREVGVNRWIAFLERLQWRVAQYQLISNLRARARGLRTRLRSADKRSSQ
ncbi:glycosyltransferase [Nocardioides sp. SYSU DS0663]|uniref:glycosyltransferase n=1 Tax=Nocardioides sp. SYSU DS0663 TaxID=3416445 RepID=UPI003F4BB248